MSQGVYHVYNAAKTRIMEAVYKRYPNAISAKEIAHITGMEQNKVSRLLSHYQHRNYGYFRRMKKKDLDGSYRYKINKKGVKAYFAFVMRIKSGGYDLNLKKKAPIKMATCNRLHKPQIKSERNLILSSEELAPYVRLSYRGEHELGVRKEDALKIVGIIKEESVETAKKPDIGPIRSTIQVKNNDVEIDYIQASIVIREEVKRIQEKLKTVEDIDEIKELRNRLNKCLRWHEENKEILQL